MIENNDLDNPRQVVSLSGYFGAVDGGAYLLPDSGQTQCFAVSGQAIVCPAPGSPLAQDGSYHDNSPSLAINDDGTVLDSLTGLLWQQEDDRIERTWGEAEQYCETLTFGGHDEWRLPSKKELFGLVNFGRFDPAIDTSFFRDTQVTRGYWTATPDAGNTGKAWTVKFDFTGSFLTNSLAETILMRCVLGTPLPSGTLTDNGDSTVTDRATGLIWQQGENSSGNWAAALQGCENLTLAGYADWRLPNIRELESLTDDTRTTPCLETKVFPGAKCGQFAKYWSSTTSLYKSEFDPGYIDTMAIDFDNGSVTHFADKTYSTNLNYRCVRGGTTVLAPTIIGLVSGEPTGVPLAGVTVTATDAAQYQTSTVTGGDGGYLLTNLPKDTLSLIFDLSGYQRQQVTATVDFGQRLTIDARLSPVPPLTLVISTPAAGARVDTSLLVVSGQVSNEARVTVNGVAATVVDGLFQTTIPLSAGANTIEIVAVDSYGQTKSATLDVTLLTTGTITGTATDAMTNQPLTGALVTVTDSLGAMREVLTGAEGSYTIADVASGSYTLTIATGDYGTFSQTGSLTAGEIITINAAPSLRAPEITSIIACGISGYAATITWTTDQSAASRVEYGTTTAYGSTAADPALTTSHSLALTGLVPGSTYQVRVSATNSHNLTASTVGVPFTTVAPPALSGIAVFGITADAATINWTTDQPTGFILEYGSTAAYGSGVTDPVLTTSHSHTLTGLTMQAPCHYRITATNAHGIPTVIADQTFSTASPITLTISSPVNGTLISRSDVMVRATFSNLTGNEAGITVNGRVALVSGNEFFLNHLPLNEGSNTLDIVATDTGGYTASASVTAIVSPQSDYLRMTANLESGIAPFETVLRIDGSFSAVSPTLSYLGPGNADLSGCTSNDACEVKISTEGTYTFTVSASGPGGMTYQDSVTITVQSKTALDTLLQAKWNEMKSKLSERDIEGGLEYFIGQSRDLYRPAFTALSDQLPLIFADMSVIEMIYVKDKVAKYRIRRMQEIQGVPREITYYIYFSLGKDGLWKIQNF